MALNTVKKLTISLLVSIILAVGFSFLAYGGLYQVLEAQFFAKNVERDYELKTKRILSAWSGYREQVENWLNAAAKSAWAANMFKVNLSKSDIDAFNAFVEQGNQKLGISGIRFIGPDLLINASSFYSDLMADDKGKRAYKPREQVETQIPWEVLAPKNQTKIELIRAPDGQGVVWSIPVVDSIGANWGTIVAYGNTDQLTRTARSVFGNELIYSRLASADRVIVNSFDPLDNGLDDLATKSFGKEDLSTSWGSKGQLAIRFVEGKKGELSAMVIIPMSDLTMPDYIRVFLIGIVFITMFLLIFLILNIKQDHVVVLTHRIKKLQLSLLTSFLDNKGQTQDDRWVQELKGRRDEVQKYIKKGLGRSASKKAEVDDLINAGWDEIIEVLGAKKAPQAQVEANVDFKKLEGMIEKVLKNYSPSHVVAPVAKAKVITQPQTKIAEDDPWAAKRAALKAGGPIKVEEVTDDEDLVEEIAEAADEAEEIAEAEAVEDAEEIEEVEALEEAEVAEDAEEIEEVEALEEAEAVEDAEEIDEVEALEEAEAVEDAEEIEEVEALEEAEALEDAEEIEEVEALEEVEAVEDPWAAKRAALKAGGPIDVETISEEADSVDELVAEADDLDEEPEPAEKPKIVASAKEDTEIAIGWRLPVYDTVIPNVTVPKLIDTNWLHEDAQEIEPIDDFGVSMTTAQASAPIEMIGQLEPYDEFRQIMNQEVEIKSFHELVAIEGSQWEFNVTEEGVIQIPNHVYHRGNNDAWHQLGEELANREQPDSDIDIETRSFYNVDKKSKSGLAIVREGIDLESFMGKFPANEGGRIKAMYALSKSFQAEFLLLGQFDEHGFVIERKLGMQDFGTDEFKFKENREAFEDIIENPAVLVTSQTSNFFKLFSGISKEISGYKSLAMIPVWYAQASYYLILGYSSPQNLKNFCTEHIEPLSNPNA